MLLDAFSIFQHLSALAKRTVHLAGTPTTAQCSPCDHWGKQRFSFCWGEVGICHIWIHFSMMWLFDTCWYFLKVNMAWFKRMISNSMLKGDGQKMVTGRFSQGQFHVVSEAEFGIGIWARYGKMLKETAGNRHTAWIQKVAWFLTDLTFQNREQNAIVQRCWPINPLWSMLSVRSMQ